MEQVHILYTIQPHHPDLLSYPSAVQPPLRPWRSVLCLCVSRQTCHTSRWSTRHSSRPSADDAQQPMLLIRSHSKTLSASNPGAKNRQIASAAPSPRPIFLRSTHSLNSLHGRREMAGGCLTHAATSMNHPKHKHIKPAQILQEARGSRGQSASGL